MTHQTLRLGNVLETVLSHLKTQQLFLDGITYFRGFKLSANLGKMPI